MGLNMLLRLLMFIGFLCIHAINGQEDPNTIHIEQDAENMDNGNDDNHVNSKEIEKKGGFHFMEITLITMATLNLFFIIYCCIAEKTKRKTKSKYLAVSGDEFQFDINDMDNSEMRKNAKVQVIDIGVNNDVISDDQDS